MFTGIIEEMGQIKQIEEDATRYVVTISAKKVLEDVHLGDSIAVNGICLTVTSFTNQSFTVDVMPETIKATSLSSLHQGSYVNLERAMAANGRFGGHIVSGHVDGTGKIISMQPIANAIYIKLEMPTDLAKYVVPKGSITVDGISLTVVEVMSTIFSISIIPHTLKETVLQYKKPGDIVNLEGDVLAKYLEKLLLAPSMDQPKHQSLTLQKLADYGYI